MNKQNIIYDNSFQGDSFKTVAPTPKSQTPIPNPKIPMTSSGIQCGLLKKNVRGRSCPIELKIATDIGNDARNPKIKVSNAKNQKREKCDLLTESGHLFSQNNYLWKYDVTCLEFSLDHLQLASKNQKREKSDFITEYATICKGNIYLQKQDVTCLEIRS